MKTRSANLGANRSTKMPRKALLFCGLFLACLFLVGRAQAAGQTLSAPDAGLQNAAALADNLRAQEEALLTGEASGFSLTGSLYSKDEFLSLAPGRLSDDARSLALLVDGAYGIETTGALKPYLSGGLGIAYHREGGLTYTQDLRQAGAGDMLPVFRLGAGLVYPLGPQWDLSLNYRAGFVGAFGTDELFTGRAQESVGLQTMDVGLKLRF